MFHRFPGKPTLRQSIACRKFIGECLESTHWRMRKAGLGKGWRWAAMSSWQKAPDDPMGSSGEGWSLSKCFVLQQGGGEMFYLLPCTGPVSGMWLWRLFTSVFPKGGQRKKLSVTESPSGGGWGGGEGLSPEGWRAQEAQLQYLWYMITGKIRHEET